jgi:hypothetical protein
VKDKCIISDHHRVASITPPLKSYNNVSKSGEEINHLPLSLITPLGTDNDNTRHNIPLHANYEYRNPKQI